MSKNPKLYKSIYHYSSSLDILNTPTKKFPSRVLFIRDYNGDFNKLKCPICNKNYCLFSYEKNYFNKYCKKCFNEKIIKYPQKEWFKEKYGEEWEVHYKINRDKITEFKVNSVNWFIKKYGDDFEEKRKKYIDSQVERILKLKTKRVSKISQELFWEIYNRLSDKNNCYFHELNKEIFLHNDGKLYFPDFVYKNKIIEYDGKYWHNKDKDDERNQFYTNHGYKLLVIDSDEYNKKRNQII
jgi:very-short-patch-repair endonuclease/ribosomal protein S27E